MNELARVLLLALGTTAAPALSVVDLRVDAVTQPPLHAYAQDAWLGPDKFRHFWTSYAVTAFSFAAARSVDLDVDAALIASLGTGALAGIGKEFHDRRGGRIFSLRDLVADALGLGAAYLLLRRTR